MAKKILIADDEDAIRELIRLTLEDEGYELYEAIDGQQALLKAQEIKPDLIILDVIMPRVVGYMVCREIKENPETQNSIILFISSRSSRTALNTMEMEGGDDYIVCREIKSSEETKHIHVLCLSSRSNVGAIETMKMFGADDFLAKPFEPRSLREKVKQALRRA